MTGEGLISLAPMTLWKDFPACSKRRVQQKLDKCHLARCEQWQTIGYLIPIQSNMRGDPLKVYRLEESRTTTSRIQ
ncbi:hypothetical protein TNCV_1711361 [Trichonephila clavipes]|nr:hypothetical protein TNCV_1711361 [Trichonephila clavipes]